MKIRIFEKLQRKKSNEDDGEASPLARVLTLLDLTALGVGSTLGLGVYVLAGSVAKTIAGPAVCLSFLVAAIASAFAALCYAEFAARVPKAGSAYVYSYVTIGEFVAFVIGWNLILEYVIGTASVARGLSNYIDALADKKISEFFTDLLPMDIVFLARYPDFLSFFFVMLLTALLAFGVKESSNLNNVFTLLNLITITIAIVAGSIKADVHNWNISLEEIDAGNRSNAGTGGFAPFGFTGIMAGAARCFYGFVGFDAIATTGEEAINPQRDIPLSIVISLAIIFGAYFAISTVLTMALPYYLQDADAPFPVVFDYFGWHEIKWVVTIGAIFALCTSLLGAMFPLPRVLYAMSNDGIIFRFLAKVNSYTKTPLVATILSGLLSATMATIFDLEQLIDMMSIGTLLAYSIVAVSVLVLRYEPDQNSEYPGISMKADDSFEISLYNNFKNVFNLHNNKYPSRESSQIVNWSVLLFCVFCTLFCAAIANGHGSLFNEVFITVGFVISLIAVLVLLVIMIRQPTNKNLQLSFTVPLIPYIPCLSVLFNVYLMVELDVHTWIRFVVWLFIGFLIYFMYGVSHSTATTTKKTEESIQMEKEVTKF